MPAFEIAPIGTGKRSRPDAAHRSALPETVVDIRQFGFAAARVCGRLPNGNTPRRDRNLITGSEKRMGQQHEEGQEEGRTKERLVRVMRSGTRACVEETPAV